MEIKKYRITRKQRSEGTPVWLHPELLDRVRTSIAEGDTLTDFVNSAVEQKLEGLEVAITS